MGRIHWRERMLALTIAFCLLAAPVVALAAPGKGAGGSGVAATPAVGGSTLKTRFVIGLKRSTKFHVFSLDNPNRVVVDLETAEYALPSKPARGPVGLVSSFHGGAVSKGRSRIVIEVTEPVIVEKAEVESIGGSGHQLFLEIVPTRQQIAAAPAAAPRARGSLEKPMGLIGAGGLQPPLPRPAERPEQLAEREARPVIVIDPGHGGHDSGARKHGVVEKEVVLAFSLVLRDLLNATGRYRVLMTRDDDTFVTLDGRRKFAEKHRANLFIAVHADYASTNARGATIFSLRPSVANKLKKAARPSASDIAIPDTKMKAVEGRDRNVVADWLADLAGYEVEATSARTSMFQRSVINFMGNSTNMRSNPDRSAAFSVLKTAQFPSVLIELAFVTNKQDAALLSSETWRKNVAGSIVQAVDNYFSHQAARMPILAGAD